jgi:hypothetical protein
MDALTQLRKRLKPGSRLRHLVSPDGVVPKHMQLLEVAEVRPQHFYCYDAFGMKVVIGPLRERTTHILDIGFSDHCGATFPNVYEFVEGDNNE